MATTISIKFDLDLESATFKKFVLTDTNGTDGWTADGFTAADIIGYFKVTGPMGVVYTGSFADPDTNGADPDWTLNTVEIPTINNVPDFMFGTYVFEYFVSNDAGETVVGSTSVTYVFDTPSEDVIKSSGSINTGVLPSPVIDCFRTNLKLTDETDYGAYSSLARTMTLHPPDIADADDATSTGPVLSYTFTVVNAAYECTLNSLVTYTTGVVSLVVRVLNQQYPMVKCSALSAQLLKCYLRYVDWFHSEVCSRGGHQFVRAEYLAEFMQVSAWINAYNAALQIGDWVSVTEIHDDIDATMNKRINCDCGCDTDQPTIITPYTEIVTGSSYVFEAGPGLAVSVSGTSPITVTYRIADALYTFLTSLYADSLTSSDSSVGITSSVAGTTKTWDLTVKNSLAFNLRALYSAGNDLTCTITGVSRQGTRYITGLTTTGVTPSAQVINFPHASVAALNAELAVFLIRNFHTTPPGSEFTDKLDVDTTMILNAGISEGNFTAPELYHAKVVSKTATSFYIQIFDIDGLPINMATFILNVSEINFTIKINA